MKSQTLALRALIVGAAGIMIGFSVHASGGPDKPTGVLATVDFTRIEAQYKSRAAMEADLKLMKDNLDSRLQRRDTMPFLSEDEQKELDTLLEKDVTARSDKEKARITELQTKGVQAVQSFNTLRQKPDTQLTDDDKKKLKDSEDIIAKAQQTFQRMKDDSDTQLKEYVSAKTATLMESVRAAIGRVAAQKGIAIVFNSDVAPYAGTDITAPVLADLNKK